MKILLVVLVIIFIIVVAFARGMRKTTDPDQQVLNQLQKAGSNLGKPHHIEFFLYFPTRESAQKVADTIKPDGFEVEVKPAATGSQWLCFAKKRMIPLHDKLIEIRKRFDALAKEFRGEYDGWGTTIEE